MDGETSLASIGTIFKHETEVFCHHDVDMSIRLYKKTKHSNVLNYGSILKTEQEA